LFRPPNFGWNQSPAPGIVEPGFLASTPSLGFAQMDIGGFLWLIIDVTFVLALGAVLIYGVYQWRRRRRVKVPEEVEKRAVDRAYRD
jgi:hypothetical protein